MTEVNAFAAVNSGLSMGRESRDMYERIIGKVALYQLSYSRSSRRVNGLVESVNVRFLARKRG